MKKVFRYIRAGIAGGFVAGALLISCPLLWMVDQRGENRPDNSTIASLLCLMIIGLALTTLASWLYVYFFRRPVGTRTVMGKSVDIGVAKPYVFVVKARNRAGKLVTTVERFGMYRPLDIGETYSD